MEFLDAASTTVSRSLQREFGQVLFSGHAISMYCRSYVLANWSSDIECLGVYCEPDDVLGLMKTLSLS